MPYDDPIKKVVEEVKKIVNQSKAPPFSSKRLNEVGDVYERYGYGTAEVYLTGKDTPQDRVLLRILKEIHRSGIRSEIGAYLLRKLQPVLNYKEGK